MSYQIVKGWPGEGAIDEVIIPATGVTLVGGKIAAIDAAGKATVATYTADGANANLAAAFVMDVDSVTGNLLTIMNSCLIEIDVADMATDTYLANDNLTAALGKFAKTTGAERVVGKVRSVNATTGKVRILWNGIGAAESSEPGLDSLVAAGFGATAAFPKTTNTAVTLLAANATVTRVAIITCIVTEVFADGTGAQPVFIIGEADTTNKFAANTLLVDAALGDTHVLTGTLTATKALLVTGTAATGTGTGAITVSALVLPAAS